MIESFTDMRKPQNFSASKLSWYMVRTTLYYKYGSYYSQVKETCIAIYVVAMYVCSYAAVYILAYNVAI